MTIICEITSPDGRLNGRLDAAYSNEEVPVRWEGDIQLLKSPKVPAWLREMPDKLDASTFESSAASIAEALGGTVATNKSGLWRAPDEIVAALPSNRVRGKVKSVGNEMKGKIFRLYLSEAFRRDKRHRVKVGDTLQISGNFTGAVVVGKSPITGVVVASGERGLSIRIGRPYVMIGTGSRESIDINFSEIVRMTPVSQGTKKLLHRHHGEMALARRRKGKARSKHKVKRAKAHHPA